MMRINRKLLEFFNSFAQGSDNDFKVTINKIDFSEMSPIDNSRKIEFTVTMYGDVPDDMMLKSYEAFREDFEQ